MDVRATDGGVVIRVRVRPRSSEGVRVVDDQVVVSVSAPPLDGRATDAARRALARALGLPPSAVRLRSGGRSRSKLFEVAGRSPEEVLARLSPGDSTPGL